MVRKSAGINCANMYIEAGLAGGSGARIPCHPMFPFCKGHKRFFTVQTRVPLRVLSGAAERTPSGFLILAALLFASSRRCLLVLGRRPPEQSR